jgi:hypothetical protein
MISGQPSLHLLHPELAAAISASPSNATFCGDFVYPARGNGEHTISVDSRIRPLFQKHALPRLARMLPRPLFNHRNGFFKKLNSVITSVTVILTLCAIT